jgi:S-adenosylmethionine:tRNA ribosyltransferase-isomerase
MSGPLLPAAWPREAGEARLLWLDPPGDGLRDASVRDLPSLLRPGDLLVVNDAGTLPASLVGESRLGPVEARLTGPPTEGPDGHGRWSAVLFGAGSWKERTEDRPPPPALGPGERLVFGEGALGARVHAVKPLSPRLVDLAFDRPDDEVWPVLFRVGRPVQYSYLRGPLSLWHVQTPYGARPWAVEMPSAGWPLDLSLLRGLAARGVALAALTHAAGLSSTGDPALDAALPLPERSDIPEATVQAVEAARRARGRVIAAGTTVVRALEGRAAAGPLRSGAATTDLRLGPAHAPRIVDGVLTGLHAPGESHFDLVQAFAPRPLLERALDHARARGYVGHEFGDLSLILPAA